MHSPGPPGGVGSFILPKDYRPAGQVEFAISYGHGDPCFDSDCPDGLAALVVQPDGLVYVSTTDGRAGYPYYGASIDGVTFSAK
jgi:hypothetical protein